MKLGLFLLTLIIYPSLSYSDPTTKRIFVDDRAKSKKEKTIPMNTYLADWVDKRAKQLDLALSGKKYSETQKDSRAIISQEAYWLDHEGMQYRIDLDLDLALPNFEKKYKLLLSNYNRNKIRRSNYARRQYRQDNSDDYGATIAILRQIGDFDISFEPRIEISDPIATYYTLRLERRLNWKSYSFKTRLELFADSEKGTGQFLSLSLRKDFWKRWSHYLVFEEEYRDAFNYISTLYGYTLYYRISDTMSINNSLVFTYNNEMNLDDRHEENDQRDFNLVDIFVGPAFTHEIIPNEIHYTVNYIHVFSHTYNFKGRSSASILLSFIF